MAHVLVVDDEAPVRNLVARVLEQAGHLISTAQNGREALERLQVTRPDLIVLDLVMPDIDGWTFARLCQDHPGGRGVPIVVLSASSFAPEAYTDLAGSGVKAVIQKPFSPNALIDLVAAHLPPEPSPA